MEVSLTIKDYVESFDGTRLYYEKNTFKNEKAIILIIHGLAEHLGRYEYVKKQLLSQGYGVYSFDNRGHGRSEGNRGDINRFNDFIEDTDTMVNLIKENHPGKPIYVLGHSMGGFIATSYGIKYPDKAQGQILSGAATIKPPVVTGIKSFFFRLINKVNPNMRIENKVSKGISRNSSVVKEYESDPLVLKNLTLRFYVEFLIKGIGWLQKNISNYRCPCLILHGEGDTIVSYKASEILYANITSKDKTLKIYENLYHEILNEDEKDEVIEDISKWLDARTATI